MKRILLFVLLVTMLAACKSSDGVKEVNNNVNNEINNEPTRPDYLYLNFEEETRVEFNSDKKTIWSEGDQVIRFGTDIMDVWRYTGLTGEETDRFEFVEELEVSDNYDFKERYYVLYSYDDYLGISFPPDGPEVMHTIKATQNYEPDTYDHKSTLMVGESGNEDIFSLSNLMGYLHLPLTGTKTITKITITGNNNEILNGTRSFILSDPATSRWEDNTTATTTLDCGEGVKLSRMVTDFYITLVPTVFSKGFSVDIYLDDNTSQHLSTDEKMTIERNRILNLQEINITDIKPENPKYKQTISIQHSGDIVAFPVLDDAYYIEWGDGLSSTLKYYSDITGSYVYNDGKSSHTITIYSNNASQFNIESCAGISEIDLSNL